MPLEAGLIIADPYGAEIVGEAELQRMARPAAGRSCFASPRPPATGCIVWPILWQCWISSDGENKRAASRRPS